MKVILLLLYTTSVFANQEFLFFVPEIKSTWKDVSMNQLICPMLNPFPEVEGRTYITKELMTQDLHPNDHTSDGYLCHGLTYSVICEENFFGALSITKKITRYQVNEAKCRSAYKAFTLGELTNPFFPAEDCVWMAINEVSSHFILIKDQQVQFDYYKMGYVSPIFKQEICSETSCATIHDNTIWLSNSNISSHCPHFREVIVKIYEINVREAVVVYNNNHFENLKTSCKIKYCGITGARFSNGLFFGSLGERYIKYLTPCPEDSTIGIYDFRSAVIDIELSLMISRERSQCLEAISRAQLGNRLDFLTLSFMEPKSEGTFKAFRLNKNKLQSAYGTWYGLTSFAEDKDNAIGYLKNGSLARWSDWVESGINGLLSGYNGVFKDNRTGSVKITRKEILQMEYSQSILASHVINIVDHPEKIHYETEGFDKDIDHTTSGEHRDFVGWVGSAWDNFWGKLGIIFTVIISLIVLILIVKICYPCFKAWIGRQPTSMTGPLKRKKQSLSNMVQYKPSRGDAKIYMDAIEFLEGHPHTSQTRQNIL